MSRYPARLGHVPRQWPLSVAMQPLGALPTAPRAARAYVQTMLTIWGLGYLCESAGLIVSELVANGVNASAGEDGPYRDGRLLMVQVILRVNGTRVRAEVWDEALGAPTPREAANDAETGRGLHLVEALATRWGWHNGAGPGHAKCVWAELAGELAGVAGELAGEPGNLPADGPADASLLPGTHASRNPATR